MKTKIMSKEVWYVHGERRENHGDIMHIYVVTDNIDEAVQAFRIHCPEYTVVRAEKVVDPNKARIIVAERENEHLRSTNAKWSAYCAR